MVENFVRDLSNNRSAALVTRKGIRDGQGGD